MDFLLDVWPYIAALLPTIGLAYLFYVVMKHIVEGDRRERIAQRQWEAEHPRPEPRTKLNGPDTDQDISRKGHS